MTSPVTDSLASIRRAHSRAFSALEILIAVIILGILAGLVVPTVQNRVKEARIRTATNDVKTIVDALTRVAIDSNYFVPLHILDDVHLDTSVSGISTWDHNNADAINLEETNPNVASGKEKEIFIDIEEGDFVDSADNRRLFDQMIGELGSGSPSYEDRKRALDRFRFVPPYVSWNRDGDDDDMQDDPWGNPYFFFTPKGMVHDYDSRDPLLRKIQHEITEDFDYTTFSGSSGAQCDEIFDRYVVLSMGPDGMPGDDGTNFAEGDDIFMYFN